MAWGEQVETTQGLNGERRDDRRYDIQLELRWKLIRRRRVIDSGTGRTLDLSSGGIMFETGRDLPAGLNVELSISWPVRLHNVAPLQLIVLGRIVRSGGGWAAIRTVQHEFRTMGMSAENRPTLTGPARTPGVFPLGSFPRPLEFSTKSN